MLKYRATRTILAAVLLCGSVAVTLRGAAAAESSLLEELVALERGALDRWVTLDPSGYLGLYAPEVTYFDPMTEARLEGLAAMTARFTPMKDAKLPFTNPRYEMIAQQVQRHGDIAILTFNLVNYGTPPGEAEKVIARWNSTEVYGRVNGKWRIVHSHWSLTKTM